MELHFERWGDDGPPVLILHGLFGSSANWRTVGKRLGERFRVYAVDQRNHGNSPHSPAFDYETLAMDAESFVDQQGLAPVAVVGHSMGGKVAMTLALRDPSRVASLVVVDIAPLRSSGDLQGVLDALVATDPSDFASRDEVDARLVALVPDARLRSFLLMNVARTASGRLRWRLNLSSIAAHFDEITSPMAASGRYIGPTLFLRGGSSDHVRDADLPSIALLFPAVRVATIADAGHWPHVEATDRFVDIVTDFLSRCPRSD